VRRSGEGCQCSPPTALRSVFRPKPPVRNTLDGARPRGRREALCGERLIIASRSLAFRVALRRRRGAPACLESEARASLLARIWIPNHTPLTQPPRLRFPNRGTCGCAHGFGFRNATSNKRSSAYTTSDSEPHAPSSAASTASDSEAHSRSRACRFGFRTEARAPPPPPTTYTTLDSEEAHAPPCVRSAPTASDSAPRASPRALRLGLRTNMMLPSHDLTKSGGRRARRGSAETPDSGALSKARPVGSVKVAIIL
jgi:hypothetical protein